MACTKPLIAWELLGGQKTKRGKAVIVFKEPTDSPSQKIEIPCGQCLMCRIDKAKEWQKRIIAETALWQDNYFVTLTYNEESITFNHTEQINYDTETGEILSIADVKVPTLVKKDVVNFNKRLRERWRKKHNHVGIRFFMCGEYGEKTQRPHYHVIFFNLPLYDLEYWGKNNHGQILYRSPELEKVWKRGMVVVGTATYESAGYVARYVLKKQKPTEKNEYREAEYIGMSRDPGIGKEYFNMEKDKIYENDKMLIPKEFSDAFFTKPPKYFDEMIFEEDNVLYENIKKDRRRIAAAIRKLKESRTSLYPEEQKLLEERTVKEKMSRLKKTL